MEHVGLLLLISASVLLCAVRRASFAWMITLYGQRQYKVAAKVQHQRNGCTEWELR